MSATTGIGDIYGTHYATWNIKAHAAADATEDLEGWLPFASVKVSAISVVPSVAATGNTTNSTNYNFINRGSDGLGTTEVANLDYATGTNAVASKPNALTVTAFTLAAGDVLTVQAEKVGTGLALGAATVNVKFTYV